MKKALALFFLTIHLFANTEVREFVKIDAFISHFYEHKEENKDLSIFQFISIHYFGSNKKDKDFEKDMELPFKTHDCSVHSPLPTLMTLLSLKVVSPFSNTGNELYFFHQNNMPISYLEDIWHPPKSC